MGSVNAATGEHEVSKDITYHCESVTDFDMPVTVTATVPEAVAPGEENFAKNSYTEFTIPEDVVDTMRDLLQADSLYGTVTEFHVISTNEDKDVNVAEDPIEFPETDIPDSGGITLQVPTPDKGIDAGPYIAGDEGEMTFSAGNIDTDLHVKGVLGDSPIEASCSPVDDDTTIATVDIDPDAGDEEDTEDPVITLNGDNPMELEVGDTYEEPGATAEDDVDGDVSDDIDISGSDDVDTSEPGEYDVTYTVSDEAGNKAEETRTVNVVEADNGGDEDTEDPVITLNGDNPMELEVGDTYDEPGATAEDDVDGDISDDIEISGADDIDTSEPGDYEVTYTVSDEAGNEATKERTVNVVEPGGNENPPAEGAWYTGEGEPNADLGDEGDLYLDTKTGDVYQKDSDGWGDSIMNITGPEGDQGNPGDTGDQGDKGDKGDQGPIGNSGSIWYANEGGPDADLGDEGDLYLNTENNDVYQKAEDGWEKITNLQGKMGATGPEGPQGPKGDNGNCDCDNGDGSGHIGDGNGDNSGDNDNGNGTSDDDGGTLPVTASNSLLLILIGTLMAAAGGVLAFRKKKSLN